MITYPHLKRGAIGVTAPSSGVPGPLHEVYRLACGRMDKEDSRWSVEKQVGLKTRLNQLQL